jgi:hypothetical protein
VSCVHYIADSHCFHLCIIGLLPVWQGLEAGAYKSGSRTQQIPVWCLTCFDPRTRTCSCVLKFVTWLRSRCCWSSACWTSRCAGELQHLWLPHTCMLHSQVASKQPLNERVVCVFEWCVFRVLHGLVCIRRGARAPGCGLWHGTSQHEHGQPRAAKLARAIGKGRDSVAEDCPALHSRRVVAYKATLTGAVCHLRCSSQDARWRAGFVHGHCAGTTPHQLSRVYGCSTSLNKMFW